MPSAWGIGLDFHHGELWSQFQVVKEACWKLIDSCDLSQPVTVGSPTWEVVTVCEEEVDLQEEREEDKEYKEVEQGWRGKSTRQEKM